jgi:hypothetical protein
MAVLTWLATVCLVLANAQAVGCDGGEPISAPGQTSSRLIGTKVGVAGHVRLGCWTEIRLVCQSAPADAEVVIRSMDSDGNWVNYRWPLVNLPDFNSPSSDGPQTYLGLFRLGRSEQPIDVTIRESSGTVWASAVIPILNNPEIKVHSANDRLWLYLGPDVELRRSLGWIETDQQPGTFRLLNIDQADSLPATIWGWDAFERVVSCSDRQTWPHEMTPSQRLALGHWLVSGGRISIALCDSWESLFGDSGVFRAWVDDLKAQVATTTDSSQIELLVTSRSQLVQDPNSQTLPYLWFESDVQRAVLTVEGKPVLTRRSCGLGQLDLLGFDPAGELFAKWPSRGALLIKWLDYRKPEATRLATAFGYSDVTGRMRSALEQFTRVQVISFTAVALIILGFVALLIVDYFFLKHVLRDMKWAWLTLPLCCGATCTATWLVYRSAKPDTYQLNQAELIDIDGTGGQAKLLSRDSSTPDVVPAVATGRFWASLYSPSTGIVDLKVGGIKELPLNVQESNLGWLGLPGSGLGGMQSANKLAGFSGTYEMRGHWQATAAGDRPLLQNQLGQMPLNVASSRVLSGAWSAEHQPLKSDLSRQVGRDRLTGTFTNPLPLELKDCLIVYGSWGYRLNRPLGPGETVDLDPGQNQAKPESFEDWLRRPNSNLDDLSRNLELLMFYEQAGGAAQSRLLQGYQSRIDLSHVSRLDRAILIGRHDGYVTELHINNQPLDESQRDRHATTFRIIFPVAQAN